MSAAEIEEQLKAKGKGGKGKGKGQCAGRGNAHSRATSAASLQSNGSGGKGKGKGKGGKKGKDANPKAVAKPKAKPKGKANNARGGSTAAPCVATKTEEDGTSGTGQPKVFPYRIAAPPHCHEFLQKGTCSKGAQCTDVHYNAAQIAAFRQAQQTKLNSQWNQGKKDIAAGKH